MDKEYCWGSWRLSICSIDGTWLVKEWCWWSRRLCWGSVVDVCVFEDKVLLVMTCLDSRLVCAWLGYYEQLELLFSKLPEIGLLMLLDEDIDMVGKVARW